MLQKFIIFDLVEKEYFCGANPKPMFSPAVEDARRFDTAFDADYRIREEYELFPESFTNGSRILTIVPVYVFINPFKKP